MTEATPSESPAPSSSASSPWYLILLVLFGGALVGKTASTGSSTTSDASKRPSEVSKVEPASANADKESSQRLLEPLQTFLGVPKVTPKKNNAPKNVFDQLAKWILKPPPPSADETNGDNNLGDMLKDNVGYLDYFIVTVADPRDTSVNYRFDQQVDTLHKAMGAQDFVLEGFYLPWNRDGKETEYRREPGLLLYRKASENQKDDGKNATDLMMVFLVGEIPTSGIHKTAFQTAITQINRLHAMAPSLFRDSNDQERRIMIVGPTFTGSADSLARAIRQSQPPTDSENSRPYRFYVVTGSATNVDRSRFLKIAQTPGSGRVTFHATVNHGNHIKNALIKYVEERNHSPRRKMVWLNEGSTGFGNSSLLKRSPSNGVQVDAEKDIVEFTFPMNIASVREVYQKQLRDEASPKANLGPDRIRIPIPFERSDDARDFPPNLTPSISAPTAEIVLSQILTFIRDGGIEYVGITASDVRDQIFLAELIHEHAPDVQILMVESDSVFLHSEYRRTLHGTLVASSYSLFPEDQDWCFPFRGDHHKVVLTNQAYYGLYNAVTLLRGVQVSTYDLVDNSIQLKATSNNNSLERALAQLFPVAYGQSLAAPAARSPQDGVVQNNFFQPPVWVSMIGPTAIWPLASTSVKELHEWRDNAKWPRRDIAADDKDYALVFQIDSNTLGASLTPSYDPRIAPSTEFMLWFWVMLGGIYCASIHGFCHFNWANPLIHPTPVDADPHRVQRTVFRSFMTSALAYTVILEFAVAVIPFVLPYAAFSDRFQVAKLAVFCIFAGAVAIGLVATLVNDTLALVRRAYACVAKKDLQWESSQPLRARIASDYLPHFLRIVVELILLAEIALIAIGVVLTISTVLVPTPSSKIALLLFFNSWSDCWNGISPLLPNQFAVTSLLALNYCLLWQMDLLSGDSLIAKPQANEKENLAPQIDLDQNTRLAFLFPLYARYKQNQGVLIDALILLAIASWLVTLYVHTGNVEFFPSNVAITCIMYLVACGFWTVRFCKFLAVCHQFSADLKGLASGLEPDRKQQVKTWEDIVGRFREKKQSSLYDLLWSHRPRLPRELNRKLEQLSYDPFVVGAARPTLEPDQILYARAVDLYVKQFFVHAFGLASGMFIAGAMLFLVAESFPFSTEPLMRMTTSTMIVSMGAVIFWYYLEFDRNELLSVLVGTTPGAYSFNWSMLKTIALPLLLSTAALISQQVPEVWSWLQSVLEPLQRSAG